MKFDKYQLAFFAVLIAIIVIFALRQRSNWNEDNYLIMSDENGNLLSKSESYLKDKERGVLAEIEKVQNSTIQEMNNLSQRENTRWDEVSGWVDTLRTRVSALESKPSGGISENQQITLKALPPTAGQPIKFVVNAV